MKFFIVIKGNQFTKVVKFILIIVVRRRNRFMRSVRRVRFTTELLVPGIERDGIFILRQRMSLI